MFNGGGKGARDKEMRLHVFSVTQKLQCFWPRRLKAVTHDSRQLTFEQLSFVIALSSGHSNLDNGVSVLIKIEEHQASTALIMHIEQINAAHTGVWGLLLVKRNYLEKMTNNKFIIFIKSALQDASSAKIFFVGNDEIYIAWSGVQKKIQQQLITIISQSLLRSDASARIDDIAIYHDPKITGTELIISLRQHQELAKNKPLTVANRATKRPEKEKVVISMADAMLPYNDQQMEQFKQMQRQRSSGQNRLRMLVVEDQLFSRKLLYEALRGDYIVEAASTVHDGWRYFLENAPDIIFLDIELSDANGHILAHRVKEMDSSTYVVMVTANHGMEDVQLARQNHVDGFIAKPFSKQAIRDCIDKYNTHRAARLHKGDPT